MKFARGLLWFLIFGSFLSASPGSESDPVGIPKIDLEDFSGARVRIHHRVLNEYVPDIGVNEFGDSGGTSFAAGNLIPGSGFEPISIRRFWRVTDSGSVNRGGRSYHWIRVDGGGMTDWDLVTTGFLNGADYRLYRIVDAQGSPLPVRDGYLDLSRADRMLAVGEGYVPEAGTPGLALGGFVDEPGEQRIYLDGPAPEVWDYIIFEKLVLSPDPEWSHPRLDDSGSSDRVAETWRPGWGSSENEVSFTRTAHTEIPAAIPESFAWPGESAMRISADTEGWVTANGPYIFFPLNDNPEGDWYSTLEAGVEYRYELWMRADAPDGSSEVELGFFSLYKDISRTFTVNGQWRKYSFQFTAPPAPAFDGWHGGPSVRFTAPAELYIDNIRLYPIGSGSASPADSGDTGGAFDFAPSRRSMDLLLSSQGDDGSKGVLRSMYVMLNDARLESLLSPFADSSVTYDWYLAVNPASAMTLPAFLNYALITGNEPETRMKPWLNISSRASEEEWAMLFEFLAAPIDPDDPSDVAAKPWAYMRYRLRGTPEPWTEALERIFIEFANETWHNRAVEVQWHGWGPEYYVHQGSSEFGLWAEYLSGWLRENSPWFAGALESGSIEMVMGSNYDDYAERAIPFAPDVGAVGHATYVGPRWEQGEEAVPVLNDQGYQATLLGYVGGLDDEIARYAEMRDRAEGSGRSYMLYAYEGEPSGYFLPGQDSDEKREIAEAYGKSQAMAVAAADSWLGARQHGFTEMAYHAFVQGTHWSSHTPIRQGLRPHAAWLALSMLNRHTGGTMIETEVIGSPTIEWAGESLPLLGAYAFDGGDSVSLVFLNRSLTDEIAFSLELPVSEGTAAMLYALDGDPRSTNRFAMNVTIRQDEVLIGSDAALRIAPGSLTILVVPMTTK
jgi:hypothetical protein